VLGLTLNFVCGKPYRVALEQKSINPSKGATPLRVRVSDEDGKPATKAKVVLLKAYAGKQEEKVLASNKEFTPVSGDETLYELNFLDLKPDTGVYTLEVSATPLTKGTFEAVDNVELTLKIVGQATINDLTFFVTESEDLTDLADGEKRSVATGKKLDTPLKVKGHQYLSATFSVKGQSGLISVQQAFVRLYNDSGREFIAPALQGAKGYTAHINMRDSAKEFYGQSGNYKLQLIVGDASLASAVLWEVGSVSIAYPKELVVELPRNPFEPLPTITHQFRQPDKRPPQTISMAFTIATVGVPALILFIGLIRVGANLKNFPSGSDFIYAVGFEASLGAILVLFLCYFFFLNMVQTLGYLGLLFVPFLFFAHKNLNGLARSRQQPHSD